MFNFFKKLFQKKSSTIFSNQELVEVGACPNCWGRMEYDGQYIDFVNDRTKANINHDLEHRKAFIEQFVETHVTGIQLKKQEGKFVCPTCNRQI